MKKLFTLFATLVALTGWGANPAFTDMNTNQFDVSGNKVAVKDHAFITNEVAFGTLTVQGNIAGTNTSITNKLAGHLEQGTRTVAQAASSAAFGQDTYVGATGAIVSGGNNTNTAGFSFSTGFKNTVQGSAVYSISGGRYNSVGGRSAYVGGESNISNGADVFLHGRSIQMNGGIAGTDNDFLAGRDYVVDDGVSNTWIWSGSYMPLVDGSFSDSFLVHATNRIYFTGAKVESPAGFIGPFYGSNLVGSYVGVSGASPYTVSNLWSVVLPDGSTAFQLGNPGPGYASIFATNLIITPDGLRYTIFTQGTNTLFGGDIYVTNGVYHGKSFRPQLVAATIVGATAQSTNLMEIQDGSSNVLASVTASGIFTGNGAGLTNLWDKSNVKYWGAQGTNGNDQAAVLAALAGLDSAAGGEIYFPPGRYRFNITNTISGVTFRGSGCSGQTTSYIGALDPTLPVLTIGDDTKYVYGNVIKDLSIEGIPASGNYASCGLLLYGGAYETKIQNFCISHFTNDVYIAGGTNYPVSLTTFAHGSIKGTDNFSSAAQAVVYASKGPTYAGPLTFSDVHFNGAGSGYLFDLYGTSMTLVSGSYADFAIGHGVRLNRYGATTSALLLENFALDATGGAGVGVENNFDATTPYHTVLAGSYSATDGMTYSLTNGSTTLIATSTDHTIPGKFRAFQSVLTGGYAAQPGLDVGAGILSVTNAKVGVGTQSPASLLHAYGAYANRPAFKIGQDSANATTDQSGMTFTCYSDGNIYNDFKTISGGTIYWRSGAGAENGFARNWMVVNPTLGRVGIGVDTPASKLDVAGAIHSGVTNTTTPALVSLGTNNAVLRCPDGGSWILRVGNDGTLSTVTNSAALQ